MARKSYDQRLKERWLKQQQEADMHVQQEMHRFERMMNNLRPVRGLIMALCRTPGHNMRPPGGSKPN